MTLKEAYEKQRLERLSLQKTVARLEKTIESLKDGTYIDEEKAKHLRLINRLTQENQHLTNLVEKYKGYFHDQMGINSSIKYEGLDLISKYEDLKREYEELLAEYKLIKARLNAIYSGQDNTIKDLMTKINSLKDSLAKEQAKLNTDGTNSSLPTSQTPIGKTKVIPNSRKKTGRKKGGQPGHRKSVLEPLSSDEITDHVYHELSECTYCGGGLSLIDQCEKDEIDLEIRIVKRRHIFYVYQCDDCGRQIHSPIPLRLKEPVQYGSNLQALSLALINQGFVSINRTRHILSGLSGGELHPCGISGRTLRKKA